MTYFLHNEGIIRKIVLRILNSIMIFAIPLGAHQYKKEFQETYLEGLKFECKRWLEGFK